MFIRGTGLTGLMGSGVVWEKEASYVVKEIYSFILETGERSDSRGGAQSERLVHLYQSKSFTV